MLKQPSFDAVDYPHKQVSFARACAAQVYALLNQSKRLKGWYKKQASRHQLAKLSPELLADIGKTQAQADAESAKPFWK